MKTYNYTTGNTFNYNGVEYIGYYNNDNGMFSSGIENNSDSVILESQNTVLGEFISSNNQFNYNPLNLSKLPFGLEETSFSSNEIVNQNSINNKLEKIIGNYFQIYNQCLALTNYLPSGYVGYASLTGSTDTKMYWRDSNSTGSSSLSTINRALTGINNIALIKNIGDTDTNVVVQTNKSYFIFRYNFGLTTFSVIASASKTDENSNIYFSNITSLDTDETGNLYVADNGNKQVYKISIQSVVNNSRVSLNNPKLITLIGNINNPQIVKYSKSRLYIYDGDTFTIHLYNSKLSPIAKYTNKKIFQSNIPCSIEVDQNDNLLILTSTGLLLTIKSDLLGKTTKNTFNITLDINESYKTLKLSLNNSNILYVCTNKNVYKIFADAKESNIGNFKWSNTTISSVTNLSFANIFTDYNFDNILIYDNNKFMLFRESNVPLSNLEKDYFKIYRTNEVLLNSDYFNNITFNNAIYKLMYNHKILVSYLQSRFSYTYVNRQLLLDNLSVLSPSVLSGAKNTITPNFYVGVNENITPQVFNRVIKNILSYQENILTLVTPHITNTKYSTAEVISF